MDFRGGLLLSLSDLAELEPAENMTDIAIFWQNGPSVQSVLQILDRWRHLNRLTLNNYIDTTPCRMNYIFPPFEKLGDFILGMKDLSYLHVVPHYDCSNDGQLKIVRDRVNELILPRRPNFTFDISLSDD
jgi:hypothetical protein